MLGALLGIKCLPKDMVNKIIKYDCSNSEQHGGWAWPEFLSTHKLLLPNIKKLIECKTEVKYIIVKNKQ